MRIPSTSVLIFMQVINMLFCHVCFQLHMGEAVEDILIQEQEKKQAPWKASCVCFYLGLCVIRTYHPLNYAVFT